ncbi:hypothetical protein SEPCBS57363_000412 [Sporothrix epigloea]|uniref:Carbohydrate kinase PfkB domain-containing protein n=1 Tax=Sporothrix epigloea TaxID=1892477 RepID=A0ABP0D7M8_9PEZI
MKHLILTGACYIDTLLDVPCFPKEDDKLRATGARVRRGGNCPNSIEVLQQLLNRQRQETAGDGDDALFTTHLISVLPARDATATAMIAQSFGTLPWVASPNLDLCLYRPRHSTPASSYIFRSAATGSRTIVNHYGLPEMEVREFGDAASLFFAGYRMSAADSSLWHFEGRMSATTLACMKYLRAQQYVRYGTEKKITISVEVEKPGREGLRDLAAVADIVFYSKSWAEEEGYASAEHCLCVESDNLSEGALSFCTWGAEGAAAALSRRSGGSVVNCLAPHVPAASVVDTVGAGDTFVAGVLYQLVTNKAIQEPNGEWTAKEDTMRDVLAFAVNLATRKVQIDGFQGLV